MLGSTDYVGLGALISSTLAGITALVVALRQTGTNSQIADVHSEIKTGNGKTIARLADLAEGRRVVADVPADDRTPSEQHSVAMLNEPDPHH